MSMSELNRSSQPTQNPPNIVEHMQPKMNLNKAFLIEVLIIFDSMFFMLSFKLGWNFDVPASFASFLLSSLKIHPVVGDAVKNLASSFDLAGISITVGLEIIQFC